MTYGFIGTGNMGGALARALVKTVSPTDVFLNNRTMARAEALAAETEKTFCAKHIAVYGKRREIRRAASFCGAGADEEAVEFAVRQGADVLVSSDFKHHVLTLALESGLSVIQLTHYASENYGFEKYYRKIRRQAGIPCIFHTDEELL